MKVKISLDEFAAVSAGAIFAHGIVENAPAGIFMSRDGGMLKWVAVKGYADDWALYVGRESSLFEEIRRSGDKVVLDRHILNVIDCDLALLKCYRW